MMEKRNVLEQARTPAEELTKQSEHVYDETCKLFMPSDECKKTSDDSRTITKPAAKPGEITNEHTS